MENKPWFGSWPPRTSSKGVGMAIDVGAKWRKLATTTTLLAIGLIGLILILLVEAPSGRVYGWDIVWANLITHVGIAAIVASILGLTVDWALKEGLISDAVGAALGHLLPERLKPELRWLYDQKVMATQSFQVRLEHFPDERSVVFHGTVNRRLENISGEKIQVKIGGGVDEWFHQRGESVVEVCEYKRIKKGQKPEDMQKIDMRMTGYSIGYDLGIVDMEPEETIELLMAYTLCMPDHGMETLTYRFLIDRPLVTLEAPPSLQAFVTFSHREKYDKADNLESKVSSTRLERILIPHQDIRIYWHRADDVEARISKYGIQRQ